MTDTVTKPAPDISLALQVDFADILMHLIATVLAPLFLTATNGDILFARMAALQTVSSYRARDDLNLISVAQIIAYGLTSLGSLGLSMADDLSLTMILRLRNNAIGLNRSAELSRKALRDERPRAEAPYGEDQAETQPDPGQEAFEAEVIANLAAARALTEAAPDTKPAAATAEAVKPAPPPEAAPAAAPAPVAAPAEPVERAAPAPFGALPVLVAREADPGWAAIWAKGMTDVAAETMRDAAHLPPEQRRVASIRASALSSTAHRLMTGAPPPGFVGDVPSGLAKI